MWKSRLPYELAFDLRTTRVEPPLRLKASLEGSWKVRTTKPWMNLLAPLARPFFEWNHDVVVRQGGEGLARLLDVRLVRVEGTHRSQEALVRRLISGLKVL